MKFLIDQDVYAATVGLLRDLGHEVQTASERQLARASDQHLLTLAKQEGRIFVTRDRDYGGLVFVGRIETGVIYLRISPLTLAAVHQELTSVLTQYTEGDLLHRFIVVEPGGHRVRRLNGS